jgi:hypothetical protein
MLGRRWLCWIVGTLAIGERAAAILRDEIEHGALANIAAASQVWSTHHRDLLIPEATRRLTAEFGGLLDTVLDLLAPPPRSAAASSLPPPVAMPDHGAGSRAANDRALPVLRARRSRPLGGAAEIHTRLQNDGPTLLRSALCGAIWSPNPMAASMRAAFGSCPAEYESRPALASTSRLVWRCPTTREPGLYHALLQATEPVGLRALLTFPVGLEC